MSLVDRSSTNDILIHGIIAEEEISKISDEITAFRYPISS
jgi:hypothetical protein